MKFKDADINLVKPTKPIKYSELIPGKDFMYMKILRNKQILVSIGDISKSVFNKSNRWFISKNVKDINMVFFNDYILNIIERVSQDLSAYQFNFQYKDRIIPYVCSIYPCITYDDCTSFDIVIRKKNINNNNTKYFMTL
jgi:hypothetical protein